MKTIKIKKVDEYSIIDGFDQLPIDPEMTRLKNVSDLAKTPEQAAVNAEVAKKTAHLKKKRAAWNKTRAAQRLINDEKTYLEFAKTEQEKNNVKINVQRAKTIVAEESKKEKEHDDAMRGCDIELKVLGDACEARRRELVKTNPVPAHPRRNEISIFPDGFDMAALVEEYKALENKQIVVDFKIVDKVIIESIDPDVEDVTAPFLEYVSHSTIDDFRGKQYFYLDNDQNWIESEVITDLGVTMETVVVDDFHASAIEKADLTPEQLEEVRIQKLTPEQKEAEKQAAIDSALQQSVNMRSGLEIQGIDPAQALADSQAWYQEQLTKIEAKYA